MNKIAIIGSGYCGLAAAFELQNAGFEVSVIDKHLHPGGLAIGGKLEDHDWAIEDLYHHWFENEKTILYLANKLKLTDQIKTYSPTTTFFINNEFKRLDKPWHIFTFPGIRLFDRFKLGYVLAMLKLKKEWDDFDQITCEEWMIKHLGHRVYEKIWKPMLIGKWGDYYNSVNMAWFWARIHVRTPKLMYPDGGFQQFNSLLQNALEDLGVNFHLNTLVENIEKRENVFEIKTSNSVFYSDQVLQTTSPSIFLKHFKSLPEDYSNSIAKLKSMGAICMLLELKKEVVKNSYWVNIPSRLTDPFKNDIPFLVFVEHTNMIKKKVYNDHHIIYCGNYLSPDHELFNYSDQEVFELYMKGIKKLNKSINNEDVISYKIIKTKYASPVFFVNHSKTVPTFNTPIKNLYWASMSHVYPWDRGTNYAAMTGLEVAKQIIKNYQDEQ